MGLKHELGRQESDRRLDRKLRSRAFRQSWWDDLATLASRSSLIELLDSTLHLEGDVIECGVYRGGSLFMISRELKARNSSKTIYACDSFKGFPPEKVGRFDRSLFRSLRKVRSKFSLADDVPQRIERFCEYFDVPIEIVKGYFSDTLPELGTRPFCFVHLDVDLYESYRECLDNLYDRLVPGGVVVFDEYDVSKIPGKSLWPGGKRAIDEFFADRPEVVTRSTSREREAWYVRKLPAEADRA